ncbi:tetratricopeptide repeat protein [candidate division KSB1 bacterium]|nr:tetratricopeptide repeat protein [candidate division KSB1 bacterium]
MDILFNALPEIIGGLVVALILTIITKIISKTRASSKSKAKAKDREDTSYQAAPKEIPGNLPSRTNFIGREHEKARVIEALNSRSYLICIDGIGGIGKTSLALEVANECLDASKLDQKKAQELDLPTFDGFIWTTAKDRDLMLKDILDTIARVMDYPGIVKQPLEEKRESILKLFSKYRCLLVIDNFETITDDKVRDFLLHLPEPSKTLITSREQKLRQAWEVPLKGLEQDEALQLIRNEAVRLDLGAIKAADDARLLNLYTATGGAPLALKWAMGQIKQQGQALDTVLAALHGATGDVFEDMFTRSWSLLSEDARTILMVMTLFSISASKAAIEATSDVHHFDLDNALGQLVQMWLIEVTDELELSKRRYSIHPLTKSFASARFSKNRKRQLDTAHRMAEFYLKFAKENGGTDWRGYDLLEAERQNIFSVIEWCHENQKWEALREFRRWITDFLAIRGYWDERIRLSHIAQKACRELHDYRTEAICMVYDLGWTYARQRKNEVAKGWLYKALEFFEAQEDHYGIALVLNSLGYIAIHTNEVENGKDFYLKGLKYAEKADDRLLIGLFRRALDFAFLDEKDNEKARSQLEFSKNLYDAEGDEIRLSQALYGLGKLERSQGNLKESKSLFNNALELSRKAGRKEHTAYVLWQLSLLEEQFKHKKSALDLALEANEIFTRLGIEPGAEATRAIIDRLKKK